MKREQFILSELRALGSDISALVEHEVDKMETEKRYIERMTEESKKLRGVPVMTATAYEPNRLKPEVNYFLSRLHTIVSYLGDQSDKPGQGLCL